MKAVTRRIRILEVSSGLVETAGSRSARERVEILRRRIASEDGDREDLSGLTVVEILNRGRKRARQRNLASKQTAPVRNSTDPLTLDGTHNGEAEACVEAKMIKRNLFRRVEILEEKIIPAGEPTILNVQFVDGPTRLVTGGFQMTLGACRPAQGHRRGAAAPRTLSQNRYR